MNEKMKFKTCAGFALLGAFLAGNASATLMLDTGLVGGSGDVQNVLLTQPGILDNIVVGQLNQTGELVTFTSNENIFVPGGGQARIEASDGSFEFIEWELADPTLGFSKVQFNIDAEADGFADITLRDQFGADFVFSNQALDGTGQNFFTGYSLDNQVIVKVTIDSNVGIDDLQQVRLGDPVDRDGGPGPGPGPGPGAIPEPVTSALGMMGLVALSTTLRRRR